GELGVFRGGRFFRLQHVGRTASVAQIAPARGGGVWICADSKLFKYDEGKTLEPRGAYQPELASDQSNVLFEDRRGGVWIGTSSRGLFYYDGSGFETVPVSHREILSLLEDREGNIWVGTAGGLNRVQPRAVALENAATGLPFEALISIGQDTGGVVWAATQNGLLVSRSHGVWNTVSTNSNWPGGLATCVAADRAGRVWIGTQARALHCWRDGR